MKLALSLPAVLLVSVASAPACAVCFGDKSSDTVQAISQSILFMLGLLVIVLGGILAFFIRMLVRSSREPLPPEFQDPTPQTTS